MKKNIIFTAIATLLLSASCTQQDDFLPGNEAKTFTATIEQSQTRTALVDKVKVDWSEKDQIKINGAIYSATPVAGKTGVAEFKYVSGKKPEEGPYTAVYPADLYDEEIGGLYFPRMQYYEPGKLNAPMIARSNNEQLSFRNICGVICFSLTGTDKIRGIEVMSNDIPLWGPVEVDPTTAKATIIVKKMPEETVKSTLQAVQSRFAIALDCGEEGLQLSKTPTNLYIYLPEATFPASGLRVRFVSAENTDNYHEMIARNSVTVERNNIYTFNVNVPEFNHGEQGEAEAAVELPELENMLSGTFSVGENQQVHFSCGNLQATKNGDGWEWGFAEQQFSIIGEKNVYNGELTSKIDLFGWSSTATDNNYGIFTATQSALDGPHYFDSYSQFKDWGNNVKLSGREWFTLSEAQWSYLLNIDGTSGRNEANRFAKANVQGVPGLLIFPDGYNRGVAISGISGISDLNTSKCSFPENQLDTREWIAMQKNGVVFLPCAGYRKGTEYVCPNEGLYWTTTFQKTLIFHSLVFVGDMSSYYGLSVRLVTDVVYDTAENK